MAEPYMVVKNINIVSRLLVEAINEFAILLSNRALMILIIIMFAFMSAYRICKK